ncbi:MAG TPA: hypothetical protein VIJ96_19370 [Acidothermaceae bacterium]
MLTVAYQGNRTIALQASRAVPRVLTRIVDAHRAAKDAPVADTPAVSDIAS